LDFATCTGKVDGVDYTLDFFQEYADPADQPTGKGYVLQIMGSEAGSILKTLANIDVTDNADKTAKSVSMYAVINPTTLFSKFEINTQKPSDVSIYATNFGAVWGKFQCTPVGVAP
jgi:hypothetical protein